MDVLRVGILCQVASGPNVADVSLVYTLALERGQHAPVDEVDLHARRDSQQLDLAPTTVVLLADSSASLR